MHTEELYDLYSSPNIIRVITSRRIAWAGHVARMGEGGRERERERQKSCVCWEKTRKA